MLAILQINMQWTKENRTLAGSLCRKSYYKPVVIEDDINLSGDGIFLKKCTYIQTGNSILDDSGCFQEYSRKIHKENAGTAFTGSEEYIQKRALNWSKQIKRDKGAFYNIGKIYIPCVNIIEETEKSYRIRWFEGGPGKPARHGKNEDFYVKGAKLEGRPGILNETAFILKEGDSGILKYNYRVSSFETAWYICYYIYIVNIKKLHSGVFIRNYTYEYNQLADLF